MSGAVEEERQKARQGWFDRLHDPKLILWWSVAWAIVIMALSPLVNYITPFLNSTYNNQWTPDIYWRLVMYWHGGIFIPWVTVLAVLVTMKFRLDKVAGLPGRLIRESIFVGGFFAVPVAGVAGLFDVYDHFALGIPLWTQIGAFLIGDEMAIALAVSLVAYLRSGGFRRAGMPYYTVLTGVFGALFAAFMGHAGGWTSWFGPSPQLYSQYINSTMYPVLGYYNSTAVQAFTSDVVGSHSHLMLVSLMAGVVALVALTFGYEKWSKNSRRVADFGFGVMVLSLVGAIWVYLVSGMGNYQIPTFFQSGMNGVAGDDIVTGMVGLGAAFVLAGLLAHSRAGLTKEGKPLRSDPLFLSVIAAWVTIYLVIPVTGYYIELNEVFYQNAGATFDAVFTRFHQDFGFFVLPALVTLLIALESFSVPARTKRYLGYLVVSGIALAFVFGETYALSAATITPANVGQVYAPFSLGAVMLDVAVLGGVLIGVGVLVSILYLRRAAGPAEEASRE